MSFRKDTNISENKKRGKMKKILLFFVILHLAILFGCSNSGNVDDSEETKFSYWLGGVTCDLYIFADDGIPYYRYRGYPYLIFEYKIINNEPVNALFGLTNIDGKTVYVPDPNITVIAPVPLDLSLDRPVYSYENQFTFVGRPLELVAWTSVETNVGFDSGIHEFWFLLDDGNTLEFAYGNETGMMGEYYNPNPSWGEMGSMTTNSIKMVHIKTNNGYR